MGRQIRLDYPGAWHHVFNRGAAKRDIFHDDADRRCFLDLLGEVPVEIHAYALMSNHYHLVVRSPTAELSEAMRVVGREYAIHHHRRYGTDGRLCRNRFRSIVVEAESYLLTLSRYVHRNPVKAGIVRRPQDYNWSSCRAFLGLEDPPPWLYLETTLSLAGGVAGYATLLDAASAQSDAVACFLERPGPVQVLGSVEFAAIAERRSSGDAEATPDRT